MPSGISSTNPSKTLGSRWRDPEPRTLLYPGPAIPDHRSAGTRSECRGSTEAPTWGAAGARTPLRITAIPLSLLGVPRHQLRRIDRHLQVRHYGIKRLDGQATGADADLESVQSANVLGPPSGGVGLAISERPKGCESSECETYYCLQTSGEKMNLRSPSFRRGEHLTSPLASGDTMPESR